MIRRVFWGEWSTIRDGVAIVSLHVAHGCWSEFGLRKWGDGQTTGVGKALKFAGCIRVLG